ncbi:HAD-IC family P-type ATPase [Halomonas sp.]|uniref:HAD-IC family P-type ATPase n=1 Tax=Halomonas sp. TaxID=1486246 RepID=UPI00298E1DA2|nr:HAD-IC family P-type ATPase [Halomonas sp.]MDW7748644.1 HAD-IC family P-type ATPase [Halomonas sp.]
MGQRAPLGAGHPPPCPGRGATGGRGAPAGRGAARRVEERPGGGRIAWLECPEGGGGDDTLRIGSPGWLVSEGVVPPRGSVEAPACTRVDLALGRRWLGSLWLADSSDPAAAPLLASLRREGLAVALISGDRDALVQRLGAELGLQRSACFAERTPEQKLALVKALPRPSLFVGDGINDAPALVAASLGVATLEASTPAREAAAIQLLRPGPGGVRDAIDIARRTRRVMRQNLWLSALYNGAALPLVAWMAVPPQVAVAAMALSSLSVVGNSARLLVAAGKGRRSRGARNEASRATAGGLLRH